jgi:hypothetical protein
VRALYICPGQLGLLGTIQRVWSGKITCMRPPQAAQFFEEMGGSWPEERGDGDA